MYCCHQLLRLLLRSLAGLFLCPTHFPTSLPLRLPRLPSVILCPCLFGVRPLLQQPLRHYDACYYCGGPRWCYSRRRRRPPPPSPPPPLGCGPPAAGSLAPTCEF